MALQKRVSELPAVSQVAGTDLLIVSSNNATKRTTVQQIGAYFAANGVAGPQGPQGIAGAAGNSASVAVGAVTTGAPGTSASVVNAGTSSAAVLNFTIPAGAAGAKGDKGDTGATGPAGTTTWAGITDKPTTFAPSAHQHVAADISGFTSAVIAAAPPTTNASLLTSGTLPDARLSSNIARTSDISSAVAAVVDAAPASLDTLKELAAALGNDASFSATVTNTLAAKAPINNPTFTGTVGGVTKAMVGLGNVPNVDATARANHTGTQAASTILYDNSDGPNLGALDDHPITVQQALLALDNLSEQYVSYLSYATASAAGLVRIGSGVSVDAQGVISVSTNYAATSHSHGSITADGKLGTTSGQIVVTGEGGALTTASTVGISSVSGLQTALDGKASLFHAHAVGDITGFSAAAASAAPVQSVNGQTGAVTVASYTLPVATASVLGGVKQGANTTIGADGTISVAAPVTSLPYSSITGTPVLAAVATSGSAADLTGTLSASRLPAATTSTLGGVIVGTGLSVSSGTVSANVTSVAGRTGAVTIAAADVSGLGSLATQSSVAYSSLTGTPSTFSPSSHASSHASGGSDAISLAASQITSGTIAAARLGTGTADATTFLRGDGTFAIPSASVTYATQSQAFAGTSTSVTSSPARVRDWSKNWKLVDLSNNQRDITVSTASGSVAVDSLYLNCNSGFNTANATAIYRGWGFETTQYYNTSGQNAGTAATNWSWSKPLSFAFRLSCGPFFSAFSTARVQFGKKLVTTLGTLDQQGIGIEVRGGTNSVNGRLWILAHNGTTLTSYDTGLNLLCAPFYDIVLSSDGAGNVTCVVNDTAYTTTGGPTTDLLNAASGSGIAVEATNGNMSSQRTELRISRHIWVTAQ